ncbi:TA system VapC family ribonuclease toxin [Jannaschia sp. R86511]|uniref:TA system VapC family ribonuclease toxin n=1 Tax=Jannaschia sp. R86511 TaxID=3093853 RepID=UPI0036D2908B
MRALLDVNVLLALFDRDHVDHRTAQAFVVSGLGDGWASCPITQNGFVRVISQPRYPSPVTTADALLRLAEATADESHAFWPDDESLTDPRVLAPAALLGPRQVTDAYLLALAVRHGGRLVTFDSTIPLGAVVGARPHHVEVLSGP